MSEQWETPLLAVCLGHDQRYIWDGIRLKEWLEEAGEIVAKQNGAADWHNRGE